MKLLPGFEVSENIITATVLDGAELLLGVSFPPAFREIALRHDGTCGDCEFSVPGSAVPGAIGSWLSFLPWAQDNVWSTLATWPEHGLPQSVVPFGTDGGGNLVCLDYRTGSSPGVVIWHHELLGIEGLYPIAASFDQWLLSLVAVADEA